MGYQWDKLDLGELAVELNKDVPEHEIRSRKGGSGVMLSYVDQFYVIDELNRIFEHQWDWSRVWGEFVTPPEQFKNSRGKLMWRAEYLYVGRLRVLNINKEGSAVGHAIASSRGECMHNAVAEGETDAIKRAARLLGRRLGLALYDKDQRYISQQLGVEVFQHGPRAGESLRDAEPKLLARYLKYLQDNDASNHDHIEYVQQLVGDEAEQEQSEGLVPEL